MAEQKKMSLVRFDIQPALWHSNGERPCDREQGYSAHDRLGGWSDPVLLASVDRDEGLRNTRGFIQTLSFGGGALLEGVGRRADAALDLFHPAGHAIHGSNAIRRLGSPASHGCIRISPANAARLFELVRAEGLGNTKVVVSAGVASRVAKRQTRPARPARLAEENLSFYQHPPMPAYVRRW